VAENCKILRGDDNSLERYNSLMHTLGPMVNHRLRRTLSIEYCTRITIQVHRKLLVDGAEPAYRAMRRMSFVVWAITKTYL